MSLIWNGNENVQEHEKDKHLWKNDDLYGSIQPFVVSTISYTEHSFLFLSLFRLSQLNIYLFAYCRHDLSELSAAKYLAIIYNDSNINIQKRAIYTQSYR